MTAKPQPMTEQSNADDLIAELARLMAQDSGAQKPAAEPAFSLRIPGEAAPQQPATRIPGPRFDFSAIDGKSGPVEPIPVAANVPAPPAAASEPAPFRFDFDVPASRPAPVQQVAAPVQQQAATPAPQGPVAPASADLPGADAIAQLIEAELAAVRPAAPVPQPVVTDVRPAMAAERIEPVLEQKPAATVAQDQFRIPPVFGLAGAASPAPAPVAVVAPVVAPAVSEKPVIAAERPAMDPIDEIEGLIGRAVQVELEQPEPVAEPEPVVDFVPAPEPRPAPSPALRSLATPTLKAPPQPAAQGRDGFSAADETILAAAQATGAQLEWVETAEPDFVPPPQVHRPRRRFAFSRAFAGPAVAMTLLLAAGFGLYWVLGLSTPEGPAPLLAASTAVVKEMPVAVPNAAAAQQSVVFSEMAGTTPGAEEQLVSRDQADVTEVASVPVVPATTETSANRKVRTVTVRPDGTIVSGDESLAGGAILPVARPAVPEVPGAAEPAPLLASTDAATTPAPDAAVTSPETTAALPALGAEPAPTEAAVAETSAPAPVANPVEPGTYVAAVDVAGNPIPGKTAPVPMLKPQFSTAVLAAAAQAAVPSAAPSANALVDPAAAPAVTQQAMLPPPPAAAAPVAAAAPAADPGSSAPAYVQLSSQRSEEAARATAQQIVTRYGPLFGGTSLEVNRVDLGERGVFYRVRVPANTMAEANNICMNVKAAGGDCFTM